MNNIEKIKIKSKDGIDINVICWKTEGKPKGIIHVIHGMAEYKERYEEFAKYLNTRGYLVYAHDHRGHGAAWKSKLGFFSQEDGWVKVRDDIFEVTKYIHEKNNNLKMYLFGHSMGSFLTRDYVQEYKNEVDGIILSGTGGRVGIQGYLAKLFIKYEINTNNIDMPNKKLDNLIFGQYNKKCKEKRTSFDWLSRDDKRVDLYIKNDLCGFVCTTKFFEDLLSGLIKINKKKNIKKIACDLPILMISGSMDPVGDYKKGVFQTYFDFIRCGIKEVNYKFYEGARHELINEINRIEVFDDIVKWLEQHI